jgi:alpha-glucoside transport system substrate-binding protein
MTQLRTHSTWTRGIVAGLAAAAMLTLAACGGGDSGNKKTDLPSLDGKSLEVAAVWSGAEQKVFQKVIAKFEKDTGAKVTFTSTGDDIATVLNTKLKGNAAPDIGILPQPGLMSQFAKAGNLKPLSDDTVKAIDDNYASIWKDLGTVDGKIYGVGVDASNKSTVWYNVPAFEQAGIEPPKTWEEFLAAAKTLSDSGVSVPVALGGSDGWTLTDWFENLYIRSAGADNYDKLSTHEIPWTDASVVKTLDLMKQLFGDKTLVGSPGSALQTDFPGSVTNTFAKDPKSAIVYEGSFAAGVISSSSDYKVGDDAKWFPFPAIGDSPESVVGGGDLAVQFNNNAATKAFMTYLASPDAAAQLVSTGSFTSANKNVDAGAYPDENSAAVGKAIVDAGDNFRFDMSDLAPPAFGGTVGSGEWKILQDFLKNSSDPAATAKTLEASAAKAFG